MTASIRMRAAMFQLQCQCRAPVSANSNKSNTRSCQVNSIPTWDERESFGIPENVVLVATKDEITEEVDSLKYGLKGFIFLFKLFLKEFRVG